MDSPDNFAILLPFILLTFSAAFFVVSRYERQPARAWGTGYGLAALGFIGPVLLNWLPVPAVALLCDALFIGAFFFYGEALLQRFAKPSYRRLRGGIAGAGLLAAAYIDLLVGRLDLELLFVDATCALLLAIPVALCLKSGRHWLDTVLVSLAGIVVLETVIRNLVLIVLTHSPRQLEDYAGSDYAAIAQVGASIIGLLFALTALSTVALDVLNRYRHAAERDTLTDLLNRRGFEQALAARAQPLATGAVIVCDIDRFKRINDDYGHQQGDRVLVAFSAILTRYLPGQAVTARFGGEEFVIYLCDYSVTEVEVLANMLRLAVSSFDWSSVGIDRQVTASFGCAEIMGGDRTVHDAIGRADANLYAAKSEGRNRVVALVAGKDVDGRNTRGGAPSVSPVRSCSR